MSSKSYKDSLFPASFIQLKLLMFLRLWENWLQPHVTKFTKESPDSKFTKWRMMIVAPYS